MRIQLSDHFTYKRLLRFVSAPIMMMLFVSIYGVIDGLFISNFVGASAFAAANLMMPILMIVGAVGFMFGTGGTAIVSKTLGEGDKEKANRYFSLFVCATAIGGVFFASLFEILIPHIVSLYNLNDAQKLDEETYNYCVLYGRIVMGAMPCFMLQNVFHAFFSTAEKPLLGFAVTAIAGCTNIVLDALFVAVFKFGVAGAAVATAISQTTGAVLPIIYFSVKNNSLLRLCKPKFDFKVFLKACTNGASEFVNSVSSSIVSIVYDVRLLAIAGKNGVNAYGVLMYVCFIYIAIFIGYSIAVAPIVGYNYGAKNKTELKNVLKKSIFIIEALAIIMIALAIGLADPVSRLFIRDNEECLQMAKQAFLVSSPMYMFAGFSIFCSSFFTALGNGLVSALISFMRTLIFQIASVLILSAIWGLTGVWLSTVISDILAMLTSLFFLLMQRKKYGYA